MPHIDGFLTLFSIQKGWRHKYTQLKWLWIAISAVCGVSLGLLSWFYAQKLIVLACITGTLVGASLFFAFLKSLPEKPKEKRD